MRFAGGARTVEIVMLTFREDLLRLNKDDLDRRLRTAYQLRGATDSRSVEPRRLRRRAPAGGSRWSSTLTLLHLAPKPRRAS
jgi:hypothetical protein